MGRFFTDEPITDNSIYLSETESHHVRNVLRMRCGEEIIVCDYAGAEYKGVLESLEGRCRVKISSLLSSVAEPELKLILCQCLPKGDKMELIIQKCTELGISRIIPVSSIRCVSRPEGKDAEKKAARWQKIAQQAAKQCGRAVVPHISHLTSLKGLPEQGRRLFAYELEDSVSLAEQDLRNERELFLLIGPEGGFESSEAEFLEAKGWEAVGLGPRILRTETAAIAGTAVIMALSGCMNCKKTVGSERGADGTVL